MSIQRLRELDSLYRQLSEHEVVVCPEPSIADALNRRVDEPRFGGFADTPRRLASRRREEAEDRAAFLEVIEKTELSWKEAAYAVNETIHAWDHDAKPTAVLDHHGYQSEGFEEVVGIARDLPITSTLLSEYNLEDSGFEEVALVGEDQLTPLERSILPEEYDSYSLLSEERFDLPDFQVFDRSSDIVDSVVGSIQVQGPDDVAVVIDRGGRFQTLLESAFDSMDIPYYGGPGFEELDENRGYIQLLRAAITPESTVGEVRPLLRQIGVNLPNDHDDKRLAEVDVPELERVHILRQEISEMTFEEVLTEFEELRGGSNRELRRELERLGLGEEDVTSGRVEALVFYMESFDVPVEREDDGVLLVDALSSSYVDRPLVFFLGMDKDWTDDAPRRPWVDQEAMYTRSIESFQTLLQSGDRQEYLVQDSRGGKQVTPCLYFEDLLEKQYDGFTDLPHERKAPQARTEARRFRPEVLDAEPELLERLSQSSLKDFVNSPRDWMFGQVVDGPDRDYFVIGSLYHDFAEFAYNHPDFVTERRVDEAVDVLVDRTREFYTPEEISVKRTEYRLALENLLKFLEENPPEIPEDGEDTGWADNYFEDHWNEPVDSPVTEQWMDEPELGIKGMVDLELTPRHLVDFKSGSREGATTVRKKAQTEDIDGEVNYQAPVYLLELRQRNPGERLKFTFFHFTENMDDQVAGEADLEDCITTLYYEPQTYHEYLATEDALQGLREDAANDCNDIFEEVDYDDYRKVVESHDVPRAFDREDLQDTAFEAALEQLMEEASGKDDVEGELKSALIQLTGYREDTFFEEDLDEIQAFLEEQLDTLNRYLKSGERFPVVGPGDEPYWKHVDHRDLILEDRGGNHG